MLYMMLLAAGSYPVFESHQVGILHLSPSIIALLPRPKHRVFLSCSTARLCKRNANSASDTNENGSLHWKYVALGLAYARIVTRMPDNPMQAVAEL